MITGRGSRRARNPTARHRNRTAASGNVFPGILPTGWTRVSDTIATYLVALDAPNCSTPTAMATPAITATATILPPAKTPATVPVTNLPNTGAGSSSLNAMLLTAATAGALTLAGGALIRTQHQ